MPAGWTLYLRSLTPTTRPMHVKVDMRVDPEELGDSFNAEDEEISPFTMLREVRHYVGSVRSDKLQRCP